MHHAFACLKILHFEQPIVSHEDVGYPIMGGMANFENRFDERADVGKMLYEQYKEGWVTPTQNSWLYLYLRLQELCLYFKRIFTLCLLKSCKNLKFIWNRSISRYLEWWLIFLLWTTNAYWWKLSKNKCFEAAFLCCL